MKNSKLVELLGSLSKTEMREFEKFLRSPYFNQREDVVKLFNYLSQSDGSFLKAAVFSAIFPNTPYDEKQIRYAMSFLYQLLKSYLTQKDLAAQPLQLQLFTVRALRKRNVQRVFDAEWQATKKNLDQQPLKNLDTHFHKYFLHNEQLTDTISKSRLVTPGFVELSKELTNYFIGNILHQSCLAMSYQTISKLDFAPGMLAEALAFVEKNDFSTIPAVQIYYHCYRMLTSTEPIEHFLLLKKGIRQFGEYFPKSELKDINVLALNFCIRKVNEGDSSFKVETFELYKAGLEKGIFIDDNQLSRFTYKNIVASGLGLNEYEWVRRFIEDYKPYLAKKYRNSAYCFNLALYHFKKQEYPAAMILLQQVGTDDLLNNLNARRILLRIYYDLGELETLHSLLDSFQTYIYRKKDLGYHRDSYLNLIRSTRKLMNLDFYDKKQLELLRNEVDSKDNIYEKAWLLEKLTPDK